MRESELLALIELRSQDLPAPVIVGPGDDAAVLLFGAAQVLVTVDQLVEGRHYEQASATLDQIARKAMARGVSDIAAMGGRPACAFVAASLRAGFTEADELFERMSFWANTWSCPLAGGDIAVVDGPTVLSVTVIGSPHPGRGAVLRRTARPGDRLMVTGRLGGSLESGRHLAFEPRLAESAWLCDELGDRLSAMIDLSDGLGLDTSRIAKASGVRIEIDAAALPLHDEAHGDWRAAISAGEDYELCFTVAGEPPADTAPNGTSMTTIGRVLEGEGCFVRTDDGETIDVADLGWDHNAK
ncbi:MAG: thiamine-monophosphate kinase [Phycisphaeraceae bacterium]|nr:MAG: thiamine-monophosphate kinase [Phycisphaeraceae bacterium]